MRDLTQSSGSQAVSAPRSAAISAAPKSNAAGLSIPAGDLVQDTHAFGALDKGDDFRRFAGLSQQVGRNESVAEDPHFGRTDNQDRPMNLVAPAGHRAQLL